MMPDSSSLFLFVSAALLLLMIPGPAVFYIVGRSIGHGRSAGLVSALGISAGSLVHTAAAAVGVSALLMSSAIAFAAVKYLGAAYLIYLGIRALLAANSMHSVALDGNSKEPEPDLRGVYLGALTLQLANPKALLFFLALLPQFIDPAIPVVPQMLILAATSMVPEFCILTGYGWLAHRAVHATKKFGVTGNMNRLLARIEGVGLLGCATLVLKFNRGS